MTNQKRKKFWFLVVGLEQTLEQRVIKQKNKECEKWCKVRSAVDTT